MRVMTGCKDCVFQQPIKKNNKCLALRSRAKQSPSSLGHVVSKQQPLLLAILTGLELP